MQCSKNKMLLWPKPLDLRLERGFNRQVRRLNGDHARPNIGDTASLPDALDLRTLLREFASAQRRACTLDHMRSPPDARDIGSCRCVAQHRENGWGPIEEAPNHVPQCCRPSEIFTKLIEHIAVECGADGDSLFLPDSLSLDWQRGHSFRCGGGGQRSALGERHRESVQRHRLYDVVVHRGPLASPRRSSR